MSGEKKDTPEHDMSLVGHLTELRSRIIISLLVIAIAGLAAFPLARYALELVTKPIHAMPLEPGHTDILTIDVAPDGTLKIKNPLVIKDLSRLAHKRLLFHFDPDPAAKVDPKAAAEAADFYFGDEPTQRVYYPHPFDPVILQVKMALILSVVVSLPFILWQIWLFIRPGLTTRERVFVRPLLGGALVLFPIGASFAFFILGYMMRIMQKYSISGLDPLINIDEYLSLLMTLMLVFGFIFETPLIITLAARVGIVTPAMLRQYRRHAYVVLAFLAMVFSPADPFSMLFMLAPLIVLYEISIACSVPMARMHQRDVQIEISEEAAM